MLIPYYTEIKNAEGEIIGYTSETNLPTPSEVRNRWCYGLPLTNERGAPMPDADLMSFIKSAVTTIERRLGIFLKPTVIVSHPDARGLQEGVDFDVEEPPYDYDAKAWATYGFLQLRHRPVIKLSELKLVLPSGQVIIDFATRPEWIKLYKDVGQVQLVPYAGVSSAFSLSSPSGYPFTTGALNSNIPQMIYTDYTAGYGLHKIPEDIRNAIAKVAAIDVLGIAGDAILAGVASSSTSMDGFSESVSTTASATNATYGAHILQYQKEVDNLFDIEGGAVRTSERGITMTGL